MPSSIAHASAAILLAPLAGQRPIPPRVLGMAALAAALPDLDAIGRPFGLGDVALLGGHRAVTHSVWFALLLSLVTWAVVRRRRPEHLAAWRLGVYVSAAVLSHALLDTLTTYGEGVALLAPFSMHRWKAGWQPFSGILFEIVTLWLPALLVLVYWRRSEHVHRQA